MMLQKPEESTHGALLMEKKTKLLIYGSKPQSTRGSLNPQSDNFLKSTKERNRQSLNFINNNL